MAAKHKALVLLASGGEEMEVIISYITIISSSNRHRRYTMKSIISINMVLYMNGS